MSEIALSAALSPSLKPANFGVSEPTEPDAFAAIAASLGFASVQTSARQQASPAASLGRIDGAPGNVLPLRTLNAAAARAVPGQAVDVDIGATLQRDGAANAPAGVERFAPDRFAAAMQVSAMQASASGMPGGRLPAFDPWVPPQGAEGLPMQLLQATDDRADPALALGLRQMSALAAEPHQQLVLR